MGIVLQLSYLYLILFNSRGPGEMELVWAGYSILLLAISWVVVLRVVFERIRRAAGGLLVSGIVCFFLAVSTAGVGCLVSTAGGQLGPVPDFAFSTGELLGIPSPMIGFEISDGHCVSSSHLILWVLAYGFLVAGLWFDRGVDRAISSVNRIRNRSPPDS
jgi:hypothetical protein